MQSIAKQTSGLYFCIPSWSQSLILPDDSEQKAIYPKIIKLIEGENKV